MSISVPGLETNDDAASSEFNFGSAPLLVLGMLIGSIMIGIAINEYVDIHDPWPWIEATIFISFATFMTAGIGLIADRRRNKRRLKYDTTLDEIHKDSSSRYKMYL